MHPPRVPSLWQEFLDTENVIKTLCTQNAYKNYMLTEMLRCISEADLHMKKVSISRYCIGIILLLNIILSQEHLIYMKQTAINWSVTVAVKD